MSVFSGGQGSNTRTLILLLCQYHEVFIVNSLDIRHQS